MSQFRHRYAVFLLLLLTPVFILGCQGQSQSNADENVASSEGNPNISAPVYNLDQTVNNLNMDAVGFDIDDTLLFSTPAFDQGYNNAEEPFSPEFWKIVNRSDEGRSCVKPKTRQLVERHRELGHDIYVITARERYNSDILKNYIANTFDLPADHVFLEPNGKSKRIKKLGIDLYYGDSDSDITEGRKGGAKGVRILRSPESGYDAKYHPGKFDEPYVPSSAPPHGCSGT